MHTFTGSLSGQRQQSVYAAGLGLLELTVTMPDLCYLDYSGPALSLSTSLTILA